MSYNPNCVGSIPKRYDNVECKPALRPYGYSQFGAIKCDAVFTDILDTTPTTSEWAQFIADGTVVLGPKSGTFTIGDTTTATIQDGCGNLFPEFSDTTWTFTTPSVEENYADEDWFYFFNEYASNYTLFYLEGCGASDRVYLNNNVISAIRASQGYGTVIGTGDPVPATLPGFNLSITQKPKWSIGPNGVGKSGIWTMGGTFSSLGVDRSADIPGLRVLTEA